MLGRVVHGTQLVGIFLGKAWETSFSDILLAFAHLPSLFSSTPGLSLFVFPSFESENVSSVFVFCPPRMLLVSLLNMEFSKPKETGTESLEYPET